MHKSKAGHGERAMVRVDRKCEVYVCKMKIWAIILRECKFASVEFEQLTSEQKFRSGGYFSETPDLGMYRFKNHPAHQKQRLVSHSNYCIQPAPAIENLAAKSRKSNFQPKLLPSH